MPDIAKTRNSVLIFTGTTTLTMHNIGNYDNGGDMVVIYDDTGSAFITPARFFNTVTPTVTSEGEGFKRSGDTFIMSPSDAPDKIIMTGEFNNDKYITALETDAPDRTPDQEGNDATNEDLQMINNNSTVTGYAGVAGLSTTRALVVSYLNNTGSSPRYQHQAILYQISGSTTFTELDNDTFESDASTPDWDQQNNHVVKLTSTKVLQCNEDGTDTKIRAITATSDVITVGSALTISSETPLGTDVTTAGPPFNPALQRLGSAGDYAVFCSKTDIHVLSISGTTVTDVASCPFSMTGDLQDFAMLEDGKGVVVSEDGSSLYAIPFLATETNVDVGTETTLETGLEASTVVLARRLSTPTIAVFWTKPSTLELWMLEAEVSALGETRVLGISADSEKLYLTTSEDETFKLWVYDLDTVTRGTTNFFGAGAYADIDANTRKLEPSANPQTDRVVFLWGHHDTNTRVNYQDFNGTLGWQDVGPGTATWGTAKVATAFMPDTLNPNDIIVAFDDDDVYRTVHGTQFWNKRGDASTGVRFATRNPTDHIEFLAAGTAAGTLFYSHSLGASYQAANDASIGTVNWIEWSQ